MVAVCGSGGSGGGGKGASRMTSNDQMYRLVSSVASEAMGIGKSSEVLTVLGGKASCRRKFVLNVHLIDDEGSLVSRDMAIVASVAYAHDHSPVVRDEKPYLAEPPLFTTFNGVEFPAQDRPTRMVSGRASFKLAISLLSSKCDNRLFCICFTPQVPPDATPICQPCYSKPIRSISRKRTQTTSVSAGPSLLINNSEGTSAVVTSPCTIPRSNGNSEHGPLKSLSPASSSDNEAGTTPGRTQQVQNSSRSSSVTSMHYLSPKGQERHKQGAIDAQGPSLALQVLYENSPGRGHTTNAERFAGENDHHGGNDAMGSLSCTQLCSLQQSNLGKPFDRSTLSLRLSPESGSPTSGALTSESCVDIKDPSSRTQASPLDGARPMNNNNNMPSPPVARPFCPYASVGACKLPMTDFQLGVASSSPPPPFKRHLQASTSEGQNSSHNSLLERVQQLRSASPAAGTSKQKVDAMLQGFSMAGGGSCNETDPKINTGLTEISLEEEEKSLQYIEVSLQEVSREVQRRKEELRMKRRRLMEDEARMHSIIFQSSSWIESLSRGFSL